jgi:hypothetical protein
VLPLPVDFFLVPVAFGVVLVLVQEMVKKLRRQSQCAERVLGF